MGIDLSRGQRSAPMTELAVVISIACRRLQWPAHHECVHSAVTNGGGKRRALAVVLSLRVVHGTSLGISRRLLVGYYSTTMKCRSICDVECRAQGSHACMLPQVATRVIHAHTHTCMDATIADSTLLQACIYAHMHGCNHALDHKHALMAQRHAAQHAPASSHESSACTYAHMHGCNHALRHCTHGSEACSTACSRK
jgi:hypothetical protein